MSSAGVLEYQVAEKPSRMRWLTHNVWGVGDQVLLSMGNLVTSVLAARQLGIDEFGVFTLGFTGVLFANIFQSALISQPHSVLGAARSGQAYRSYTSSTLAGQAMLATLTALIALAVWAMAASRGWGVAPMLLAMIPAIVGWQFQEFVRRVLYTEHRLQAAFWNDMISYGGRTAITAAIYAANRLDGAWCFHAITLATVPAAIVGLWQIRGSLCRGVSAAAIGENWRFGRWLAGAELLNWCSSPQMYMVLSAIAIDPAASAVLRAAQIIFGPTRVLSFFLGNVLPTRFTRTLGERGEPGLRAHIQRSYMFVVPALGGYCLLVMFMAGPLLSIFGKAYSGPGAATVLILFAVTAFLSYLQMVISAALSARHQTRDTFIGNAWAAALTFILSWLLLSKLQWGLNGALVAMILTGALLNVMFWRAFLRKKAAAADIAEAEVIDDNADERRALIDSALAVLDAQKIRYCVLHGYEKAIAQRGKDVDCLIDRADLAKLPRVLDEGLVASGAKIVQWLSDGAQYVAIGEAREDGSLCVVPLHFATDYEFGGRVFYTGQEILDSRRQEAGIWKPAGPLEFGCVLVNRMFKGDLRPDHASRLSSLYSENAKGCDEQIARFFDTPQGDAIRAAAASGEWSKVRDDIAAFRAELVRCRRIRAFFASVGELFKRIGRQLRPHWGMHVVFLGPDGVGKSTVIDEVKKDLSPAFLGSTYGTFAPELLPRGPKKSPHALPPRSLPASLIKAAWWLFCYSVGYVLGARRGKARGRLVINHRYFIDAIVDPKRYRYSGPIWLLRWIWRIVPKPDLIVILDAPAEVVQKRKSEVPPEETRRQCEGYRALVKEARCARLVNADRPLPQVVANVESLVLSMLESRTRRRLRLEAR